MPKKKARKAVRYGRDNFRMPICEVADFDAPLVFRECEGVITPDGVVPVKDEATAAKFGLRAVPLCIDLISIWHKELHDFEKPLFQYLSTKVAELENDTSIEINRINCICSDMFGNNDDSDEDGPTLDSNGDVIADALVDVHIYNSMELVCVSCRHPGGYFYALRTALEILFENLRIKYREENERIVVENLRRDQIKRENQIMSKILLTPWEKAQVSGVTFKVDPKRDATTPEASRAKKEKPEKKEESQKPS